MHQRFWIQLCDVCHTWVHKNMDSARAITIFAGTDKEMPLLAKRGDWNKYVDDD